MYKFYLKSNTRQEIVNVICIAVVTFTSDSELVLNKRRASKWSVIGFGCFHATSHVSVCQKRVSEITDYLATAIDYPTYLARLMSVHIIAV